MPACSACAGVLPDRMFSRDELKYAGARKRCRACVKDEAAAKHEQSVARRAAEDAPGLARLRAACSSAIKNPDGPAGGTTRQRGMPRA